MGKGEGARPGEGVGEPGDEGPPCQTHFQAGQRRTWTAGERQRLLVCLDVSRHRGVDAFPGGPKGAPARRGRGRGC